MLFTMIVGLYTSRLVLEILGVEDYGIYSVVGGIVSLFLFLSSTMASVTQRFFSISLVQNDLEKLKRTFSVNWFIYGTIAVIAFVLLETVGLWFVNEHLKAPAERFESVRWLYHFSVLTFIATIFTTPFMAIIIAHEDMKIYAYVSIADVLLKLAVLYLLMYLPWDKLELYGMLIFAVSVINTVIYTVICVRKYSECQFRKFYWDKSILCETLSFTGWSLFGQVTTVMRNQAVTILLNQVFNPVVVAARAIAMNVTSQINLFSNNFNVGLYPPIIKAYAAPDSKRMFSLIFMGSKMTFFMMWVFALPLFLEMDVILHVWLKNPPPEAVLFTQLALVEALITSISLPITTAARAPGRMKTYELTLGSIQIAIFFVSWLVLELETAAYSVFIVAATANLIMFVVRLIFVNTLIGLPLKSFFVKVAFPIFAMVLLSAIPSFAVHLFMPKGLLFTTTSVVLSAMFAIISMYFVGINKLEREKVRGIIVSKINRLF
ncbi:lipopolysaccharide biosynthesis protein [Parapedobacter sp. DT-150]|uniref:lipopolysaccharide biosynthesis protein n=1 Tax=Parapedobacter sp. DT-150 TaxID=3396162 RepID=UPI003F53F992